MSRSYKKTPIIKQGSPTKRKWAKRQANKKARRSKNIPSGKEYRKTYCQYDLYDWVFYQPYDESVPKNKWEKHFYRK